MTRVLAIVAVVVAAGLAAVIFWPDGEAPRPAVSPTGSVAADSTQASGPASFTVLIDGEERQVRTEDTGTPMAQLPPSSWNSAMISTIRAVGNSQVLVFIDGSETILDSYTLERMPGEVAFRAGYSRD